MANKFQIRKEYGVPSLEPSNLLEIQHNSFKSFLQKDVAPEMRESKGLQFLFKSFFPIQSLDGNIVVDFVSYSIGSVSRTIEECKIEGSSYSVEISATLRVAVMKDGIVSHVKEQTIPFFAIPVMTNEATFIVNGVEKVVLSQIVRAPGAFIFQKEGEKYTATILPASGAWLKFEFNRDDQIFARIDKSRPIDLLTLLRCFGVTDTEIRQNIEGIVIRAEDAITDEGSAKFITKARLDFLQRMKKNVIPTEKTANLFFERLFLSPRRYHLSKTGRIKLNEKTGLDMPEANMLLSKEDVIGIVRHLISVQKPDYDGWIKFHFSRDKNALVSIKNGRPIRLVFLLRAFGATNDEINQYIPGINLETMSLDDFNTHCKEYRKDHPEDETPDSILEARYMLLLDLKEDISQTIVKANEILKERFYEAIRENLVRTGRITESPDHNEQTFIREILPVFKTIIANQKENNKRREADKENHTDDIDSLENKIIKPVGQQLVEYLRDGFNAMEKDAMDAMLVANPDTVMPSHIIKPKVIKDVVTKFFNANPLSQFGQQINPLSDLSQKRKISAIGRGGLKRDSTGLEARDIQPSQYGRICPIESPEGKNIGIVSSLSTLAKVGDIGLLETPYRPVKDGEILDKIKYLRPEQEKKYCIADFNAIDASGKKLKEGKLLARKFKVNSMEIVSVSREEVNMVDASPRQLFSPVSSLVPLINHCDAKRALMGCSMQKQACPLLRTEAPLVGTGMERIIAQESPYVLKAEEDGVVEEANSVRIVVRKKNKIAIAYKLKKFRKNTSGTCVNQKPIVRTGDVVKKGDILADSHAVSNGELALGKNVLVAYMIWNGFGQEDSVIISERLLKDSVFDSIHIKRYETDELETPLGREVITKDVPDVSWQLLTNLDDNGIVQVGSYVKPGDYLVGKVCPKAQDIEIPPEELLLQKIFEVSAKNVTDESLAVPLGVSGYVTDVTILSRKKERTVSVKTELTEIKRDRDEELELERKKFVPKIEKFLKKNPDLLVNPDGSLIENSLNQSVTVLSKLRMNSNSSASEDVKNKVSDLLDEFAERLYLVKEFFKEKRSDSLAGDELPDNVHRRVLVTISDRRQIEVGDKVAGRYGNKGIVSRVLPVEDMPYMEDGTPIDVVLNPLGVPGRMNISQLLEAQFGMALWTAGKKLKEMMFSGVPDAEIKDFLKKIYTDQERQAAINEMNPAELKDLVSRLENGIPIASPVFAGVTEEDMQNMIKITGLPQNGYFTLWDGLTGEQFQRKVLVGRKYVLKLYHLVKDKMHARSIGPYGAITQQPLKGRGKFGGQRMGEMEVWAVYGYGAAHVLLEMMSKKSDDVEGRREMFETIVKEGHYHLTEGFGEALKTLIFEMRGLGLDEEFLAAGKPVNVIPGDEKKNRSVQQQKKKPSQQADVQEKGKKNRIPVRRRMIEGW